jgi:hypothetical protein
LISLAFGPAARRCFPGQWVSAGRFDPVRLDGIVFDLIVEQARV